MPIAFEVVQHVNGVGRPALVDAVQFEVVAVTGRTTPSVTERLITVTNFGVEFAAIIKPAWPSTRNRRSI